MNNRIAELYWELLIRKWCFCRIGLGGFCGWIETHVRYKEMRTKYNEIRLRHGKVDDIVIDSVNIHLEDMTGKFWWLGVYNKKGRTTFHITSKSKITVEIIENGLESAVIEQT